MHMKILTIRDRVRMRLHFVSAHQRSGVVFVMRLVSLSFLLFLLRGSFVLVEEKRGGGLWSEEGMFVGRGIVGNKRGGCHSLSFSVIL